MKVNLGGPSRVDEDGNIMSGRWIDMVVEGNDIFIVSDSELLYWECIRCSRRLSTEQRGP